MILQYEGLSAINNINIMILQYEGLSEYYIYEGLSAINNIKYHDITI